MYSPFISCLKIEFLYPKSHSSLVKVFRKSSKFKKRTIYESSLSQKGTKNVNYDVRKRDKQLEMDISFGIATIDTLLGTLNQLEAQDDKPMFMKNCMEDEKENNIRIETSFFRELIYCMDHCIHHQSLIKIALLEQNLIHFIDPNFGVAFSTQIYRRQCAS